MICPECKRAVDVLYQRDEVVPRQKGVITCLWGKIPISPRCYDCYEKEAIKEDNV